MIDGESVEQGHFPWIAAVFIHPTYIDRDLTYVCAASIVSSWNIITAAHCLDEELLRRYKIISQSINMRFRLFVDDGRLQMNRIRSKNYLIFVSVCIISVRTV